MSSTTFRELYNTSISLQRKLSGVSQSIDLRLRDMSDAIDELRKAELDTHRWLRNQLLNNPHNILECVESAEDVLGFCLHKTKEHVSKKVARLNNLKEKNVTQEATKEIADQIDVVSKDYAALTERVRVHTYDTYFTNIVERAKALKGRGYCREDVEKLATIGRLKRMFMGVEKTRIHTLAKNFLLNMDMVFNPHGQSSFFNDSDSLMKDINDLRDPEARFTFNDSFDTIIRASSAAADIRNQAAQSASPLHKTMEVLNREFEEMTDTLAEEKRLESELSVTTVFEFMLKDINLAGGIAKILIRLGQEKDAEVIHIAEQKCAMLKKLKEGLRDVQTNSDDIRRHLNDLEKKIYKGRNSTKTAKGVDLREIKNAVEAQVRIAENSVRCLNTATNRLRSYTPPSTDNSYFGTNMHTLLLILIINDAGAEDLATLNVLTGGDVGNLQDIDLHAEMQSFGFDETTRIPEISVSDISNNLSSIESVSFSDHAIDISSLSDSVSNVTSSVSSSTFDTSSSTSSGFSDCSGGF